MATRIAPYGHSHVGYMKLKIGKEESFLYNYRYSVNYELTINKVNEWDLNPCHCMRLQSIANTYKY